MAFCIASGAKLSFASVYKLESISDSYTGLDDCLRDDERSEGFLKVMMIFFRSLKLFRVKLIFHGSISFFF